ncbi:hypothetical protein RL73_01665 [Liberibacter crescens]|nr:hypothetical protein RL73_01665 [Liberibacter crescens]
MKVFLGVLLFFSTSITSVLAETLDITAHVREIKPNSLSLVLDDGKTYQVSEEFNFDGLQVNNKVIVRYTVVNGKRMINDLEIIH